MNQVSPISSLAPHWQNFLPYAFFVLVVMSQTFVVCSSNSDDMCVNDNKTKDCSWMIPGDAENSCVIYPTKRAIDMVSSKSWIVNEPQVVKTQEDAGLEVGLEAYVFETVISNTGLNITLSSTQSDVKGFLILMQQKSSNYTSMRIFDFRNTTVKSKVSLYYDCYVYLTGGGDSSYRLQIRSLPLHRVLDYAITLPNPNTINASSICKWKSFVSVNLGWLLSNKIEIMFQKAPRRFSVDEYEITLRKLNSISEPYSSTVESLKHSRDMLVTFENVASGSYFVTVRPLSTEWKSSCGVARSATLVVPVPDHTFTIKILLFVSTFLLVVFVLLGLFFLRKHLLQPTKRTRINVPRVLLVYSYDCKKHYQVVERFADYLQHKCNVEVLLDERSTKNEDPNNWLLKSVKEVDYIIIIISEGVFHKAERQNMPKMQEMQTQMNRFTPALNLIVNEIPKKMSTNRFVKVYFKYSGSHHIPKILQLNAAGKTYKMVEELNKLICHLHKEQPKISIPLLRVYPRMPGHDLLSSWVGHSLNDAINEMSDYVQKNPDWFTKLLNCSSDVSPNTENNDSCEKTSEKTNDTKTIQTYQLFTPEKHSSKTKFSRLFRKPLVSSELV
ncbi:uncharacterized protein LOC106465367 [Limulus polyphemus]|uniref:Uncharacterized protein LOC106465367 n=1 Tax=Limulus polyphemus TaxID=6850 RepID=A0ABM1SZ94_LIMPO|nr:uncharacterized protein LOC106465367 [Limulus polyphemus]XP_022248950.1 uncharacterized protein LOC106465367 [Limulus polyphemus]XP_022248951.1 uncharacterized protein LOC106465367 [Limulus polyphemus]XP_022248952.1 uncharacterized protein LOC106465367 [Limulus polyphemus]